MSVACELKHVDVTYEDGTIALKNVNLDIHYGELVYLTGESGAGKTSVIRAIESSEYVSSGEVLFWGKNRSGMTGVEKRILYNELGIVYQDFKLIKHQSVLSNVMLPLRWASSDRTLVHKRSMQDRAKEAIRQVGLSGMEYKLAGLLSGGEQQRVAIARALVKGSQMIIADEPTGNLDKENAERIISMFEDLANKGVAVLVTTHNLDFVGSNKHFVVFEHTVHRTGK